MLCFTIIPKELCDIYNLFRPAAGPFPIGRVRVLFIAQQQHAVCSGGANREFRRVCLSLKSIQIKQCVTNISQDTVSHSNILSCLQDISRICAA